MVLMAFQLSVEKSLTIVESTSVGKLDSGIGGSSGHNSALAKALERPLGETKGMNGSSVFQTSFQNNYQKVSTLPTGAIHGQQGVQMLLPSSVGVSPSSSNASQVVGTTSTVGGTPNTSAIQMIPNGEFQILVY